jgi:hypothetical protein
MSNEQLKFISMAKQYSRFPAGRFRADGPYSGQRFREEKLVPALRSGGNVTVDLNGVSGFGSSFLDEAFGGLVRSGCIGAAESETRIRLLADDESLIAEIREYMKDAG